MTERSWWESIEEHLAEREEGAPDPWADRDAVAGEPLTEDQEAFLAGLSDQPVPPRLGQLEGLGGGRETHPETGNSPGDRGGPPDVPS